MNGNQYYATVTTTIIHWVVIALSETKIKQKNENKNETNMFFLFILKQKLQDVTPKSTASRVRALFHSFILH